VKKKDENRCDICGCFLGSFDNSYQSEGGWTENEGYYACESKRCKKIREEKLRGDKTNV